MFWSPGAGHLIAHTARVNAPGIPVGSATNNDTLEVEWDKEMRFNGRVLQFEGIPSNRLGNRVEVRYRETTLWCNEMHIHLNRQVLFFDDPSSVPPEPITIQCAGNVVVHNTQRDPDGRKRSEDRLSVMNLHYDVRRNYFVAEGPGEMSSVFLGSAQGFSPGNVAGNNVTRNNPAGETLNLLTVWFSNMVEGTLLGDSPKKVAITGHRVTVVFCPVNAWNDRIGRESLSAARQRGYTLECGRLIIEEMRDPANPSQSSFELTATIDAIIEGSGLWARAQTIRYNQAKSTVVMEGGASVQKTGQARFDNVSRIVYDIERGAVQMIDVGHGIGF